MAEQGSDNRNTDASVPELARQLFDQTKQLARQEVVLAKAELLATGGTLALAAIVVGTLSAALFGRQDRPAARPQAGPRGLPAPTEGSDWDDERL